jgi:hypothetical protein
VPSVSPVAISNGSVALISAPLTLASGTSVPAALLRNAITPPFREDLRKWSSHPIDLYEASLQAERFGDIPTPEQKPVIQYLKGLLPSAEFEFQPLQPVAQIDWMFRRCEDQETRLEHVRQRAGIISRVGNPSPSRVVAH